MPTLGIAECALALWLLSGRHTRPCAWAQTILLVTMNVGGLAFASAMIPDPLAMVTPNGVLLALAWRIAK
ncbi:MAG: DoxX-like family protein [Acidobacteria bacterium]|nr:DoxX-like family protein [Acidobacteriota bacterium]